jgi:phage minor structural protein
VKPIAVYDGHTRKRLAYLQNAYNIGYEKPISALWTASFSLPYSDEKNQYCEAFNLVELWDVDGGNKDKYVGLFRIMPRVEDTLGTEASVEYQLEHVLSTLLDDTMLGWHEIGNLGTYTPQVIAYILQRQSDPRWVLDICDYRHQYLYGWQDENLLSALYSVVQPFSETDFYWDFDTTSFPWRLRLLQTKKEPITDIRYRKNIAGIVRTVDPTNLTTRLYCYGYGENDNKLGIANVNGGVPYLESPNVAKYGVITQVWTDESFTIEESLKATGVAMLKKLEEPAITYELDIQTISGAANLSIGDTVRIVNGKLDEYMVVQKMIKPNLSGAPQSGKIVLGHGTQDVADSMASIADKQRISETYAQGSESIFTDSFYDNADAANPAEVTFTIPENAVHVNEIRFTARLTSFRAYSKATRGGGARTQSTSGGGSSNVTSSGGGASQQTSSSGGNSNQTSSSGGNTTQSSSSGGGGSQTSSSGGSTQTSSGTGGQSSQTSGSGGSSTTTSSYNDSGSTGDAIWKDKWNSYPISDTTVDGKSHSHNLHYHTHDDSHRHTVSVRSHTHDITIPSHTHSITIPSHQHTIDIPDHTHSVSIPSHTHSVQIPSHTHSVSIPSHTHDVSIPSHTHDITLPDHAHQIEYGIYKGPSASTMAIYLDNTLVGTYNGSIRNVNLISYMSKNANGNILRGDHTIRIVPNGLTRIEGTFQIRLFTNTHGGSQY